MFQALYLFIKSCKILCKNPINLFSFQWKYCWELRMQWQSESKINWYLYMKVNGYREKKKCSKRKIAQCGMATFIWQFKGNIKHSTSCSNATISYLGAEIESGFKVTHPKHSKYWPCPNISTNPTKAMGCLQCLLLSVVQLKYKHCGKPQCRNEVVNTFRLYLLAFTKNWGCSKILNHAAWTIKAVIGKGWKQCRPFQLK